MGRQQRMTLRILVLIGILYFCALIPFNLTGAETPEMLEIFEVDEYAQYPHVIRMLTPGETLYQTVRNFFIYLHYFYGYPFYFWSAVSLLPVKLFGGVWPGDTRITVCVLRQMLSVLPMILSVGLLTWTVTKFRRPVIALLLDVLILTMPAVLDNDFWWHPDSLTLLFLCLTFFFLDRDRMRCGRDLLFAAFFCGAAIGTKYLGFYFALAIPAYLVCCTLAGRITWRQLFGKAGLFLLVMAAAVIFSDPLLLLPQERKEILRIMKQQTVLSGSGIFLKYQNVFWEDGHFPHWITENYLLLPWLILSLAGLFSGIFSRDENRRTVSIVFAVYILTASLINLNAAASRLHYLLPILLPLAAQLPLCIRPGWRMEKWAEILLGLLLAVQIGLNLRTDADLMKQQLQRETNSASIALYHELESDYLPLAEVPPERMTRIYRDWKIYFPEQEGYAVKTDWDLGTLALIEEWHPDLILLERENVRAYSSESVLEQAVDPDRMRETVQFYEAAAGKSIPGYEFLFENDFGMVFRRIVP